MTQILHTGDTHLGYRQYHRPERQEDFLAAFRQVATDAVEADVDAVVHAGDLFHDRQPSLTDVLGAVSVLRVLEAAEIPFFGVVGNHESKRDRQWLDLFSEMGLATRLDETPRVVGNVALYGLDFVPRSQREAYEYTFEAVPDGVAYSALVSHGLFEPFEHGDWDARRILGESPVEFDIMLLGDDHTPRTKRVKEPHEAWLTYCGSTERASASEREERGYNLVSFEDAVDIRRRGLSTRKFVFIDLELNDGEGTGRVRERLTEEDLTDSVVIVTLTGNGEHVTPAEIESDADEQGALVTRINDRREREEESEVEVSFADPDQAVEQRIQELGLSPAARELDETVRASKIADSNVADTVESRVAELVENADSAQFDAADGEHDTSDTDDDRARQDDTSDTDDDRASQDDETPDKSDDGSSSQITMGDYT